MYTQTLVIVHGMGSQTPDYAQVLTANIMARLGAAAESIKIRQVLWDDIGRDEEDAVLAKDVVPNNYQMFNLAHPLLSVAESLDKLEHLSRDLRQFMVRSVGDVLIYLTPHGKQDIQNRLKAAILQARDDQPNTPQQSVSVIAHSLGSVVLYDLARYFGTTAEGQAEIGDIKLANVFTMGSPLALFSLLEYQQPADANQTSRSLDSADIAQTQETLLADGQSTKRYSRPYSKRGIVLDTPNGRWLNFYDQQDPISYKLHNFYEADPNSPVAPAPITDINVQTGVIHAHTGYWNSVEVANAIADQLKQTQR